MPTDFFLTTERFILSGRMVGVENLFIERNAELTLSEQAHTSQLKSLVSCQLMDHYCKILNAMWMIEMHIRIPFNLNFIKLIIDTVVFHHHGWIVCS
jgi:hypothetical protein